MNQDNQFIQGINYWPIHKAMYWWKYFDEKELHRDFALLEDAGFQVVRIFLTWEDFQPHPQIVSDQSLDHLVRTLDIAHQYNLFIMPTFFCGHMSGINWMPVWMLDEDQAPQRFDIYAGGRVYSNMGLRDCYTDAEIIEAQAFQIESVCRRVHGHEALYGYDLGNENSNFAMPPDRESGRSWLARMTSVIHSSSPGMSVTIGMHSEDLEEDRRMWPQDAGLYCDYLCMHGYPSYLSWVNDPLDAHVLPFLAVVTEWMGTKKVLLEEFGAPTCRSRAQRVEASADSLYPLFDEKQIEVFYNQALTLLNQEHCLGAIAWCFADYHPDLWARPPLDRRHHERYFGLYRTDHSPKPAVHPFAQKRCYQSPERPLEARHPWLKEYDPHGFYEHPKENLKDMYQKYREYKGLPGK